MLKNYFEEVIEEVIVEEVVFYNEEEKAKYRKTRRSNRREKDRIYPPRVMYKEKPVRNKHWVYDPAEEEEIVIGFLNPEEKLEVMLSVADDILEIQAVYAWYEANK